MVAIQAFTEHFPVSTLPRRNRAAPDRLIRAYRHRKPLVLLLGDGRTGPRLVIDAFLDRIEGELDVIRLSAAKTNVIGCTKSIVEALGFETGGLEPSDLGQILTMFLCYQKTHRRRTLICLEDAQDASGWALDELSALVGRELHKRHGLLVVLAGQRTLDDRLRLPAFEILGQNADPRIALSPYDLAETRLYLQRLIEARGLGPIADIIEFDAITRIYEVTNGVPESIEKLLSECLVESRQSPIITGLVDRVAGRLCLASPATGSTDAGCDVRDGGQLFVNVDGRHLAESTIKTEKFRIGRDLTADLR